MLAHIQPIQLASKTCFGPTNNGSFTARRLPQHVDRFILCFTKQFPHSPYPAANVCWVVLSLGYTHFTDNSNNTLGGRAICHTQLGFPVAAGWNPVDPSTALFRTILHYILTLKLNQFLSIYGPTSAQLSNTTRVNYFPRWIMQTASVPAGLQRGHTEIYRLGYLGKGDDVFIKAEANQRSM